jgi:phage regulator Rha-like protein
LDALSEKTAQAAEQNPHKDQHGYSANCNLCHHVHKKSTNYCLTCHAFNWPVP